MVDLFNYFRRETTEVNIGAVPLGGPNSIRVQSMTNTSTQDTQACVEQAKRIVDAGGEYVRLTTQGIKEAENLMNINIGLRSQGYMVPLVADVHFNPKVADVAAQYAEKVRINPGNYVDAARTFKKLEYTDEEYAQEIQKIHDRFVPFLNICKENHTATPHRSQSRFPIRPYHVPLRRHSRRDGGILHGIPAYLCGGTFHGCGDFDQGFQYGGDGEDRPLACCRDGTGGNVISPASWSDGGRRRRRRTYKICLGHRCAAL